jgi:hypothetical protein
MNRASLSPDWDDYLIVLREDAHQLLAWGYADVRAELPTTRDEYDITGLIADAMARRTDDPATPERFSLYSVRPEHPVSSARTRGKDRPRLDIQIEKCGLPKCYFTFEAKRMRDDGGATISDSLRHYLGPEGVGRFVTGRYAAESIEAAMLGYVQAHDPAFWLERVGSAFADDAASELKALRMLSGFQRTQIIPDLSHEAVSRHARDCLPHLMLFHVFLDCQ